MWCHFYLFFSKINFSGIKQKLSKINGPQAGATSVAVKDTAVVSVETNGSGRISSAIEQLTNAVKNNQDISQITSLLQNKGKDEDENKDKDETLDLKNVNQNVSKSNKRGQQKRK